MVNLTMRLKTFTGKRVEYVEKDINDWLEEFDTSKFEINHIMVNNVNATSGSGALIYSVFYSIKTK